MKTKSLCYTWLLLLVLVSTGCIHNEDDYISKFCPGSCTVIKGNIATANGTVPLPGIQLVATWNNVRGPILLGGTYRRKAVTHTDASGNYELRFLLRDDELLEGDVKVEAFIDETEFITCGASQPIYYRAGELPRDTTLVANYVLPRKATLALQLENQEAISPGDSFSNHITYKAGVNRSNCTSVVGWSAGSPQSMERLVPAEQPVIVETYRTKNGVRTTELDTLLLAPGQRYIFRTSF